MQPRSISRKRGASSRSRSGGGGVPAAARSRCLNRCRSAEHIRRRYTPARSAGMRWRRERCPNCDVPATCSQRIALNVKAEYAQAMERLGIKKESIALVKGVKGVISREKTVEAMEKGILRAVQDIYVFKDGTTRFDMIDLPLTHIRRGRGEGVGRKTRRSGTLKISTATISRTGHRSSRCTRRTSFSPTRVRTIWSRSHGSSMTNSPNSTVFLPFTI